MIRESYYIYFFNMHAMNKKSIFGGILLFIVFAMLYSCTGGDKIKVGYLIPNTKIERYKKEQVYFEEKIRELGGEAITLSAEYDDKLQIKQADELISKGVKVLVVNCVNQNTAAAIVRNAHEKNIKVIAYDRMISNCDLDYYLSFDNVEVGKQMAEYAMKLKPEGNYILLGGDRADKNAIFVKNGQLQVLDPAIQSGKVKIVYNIYVEDWSGENAEHDMVEFLKLTGITPDVILSSNDGMATGAIAALKLYNLDGKVVVTGQDAELAACRNIVQGRQSMTVYKPIKRLANAAAELAMQLAKRERIANAGTTISNGTKNVDAILLNPVVVDKDNLKATVIADGLLSESDVYN